MNRICKNCKGADVIQNSKENFICCSCGAILKEDQTKTDNVITSKHPISGKWTAKITIKGVCLYTSYCETEVLALRQLMQYLKDCIEHHNF